MVHEITKFMAKDGSEWREFGDANARENLCDEIAEVMQPLGAGPAPRSHNFYQHDPATVVACRVGILKLCAREFPSFEQFRWPKPEEVHPRSIVGRILDDLGGPLAKTWARFSRIDPAGREWEQVYYASNTPSDAKQIETQTA